MRLKVTIGGFLLGLATLLVNPALAQGPGAGLGADQADPTLSSGFSNTLMRAFSGADPANPSGLRLPETSIRRTVPETAAVPDRDPDRFALPSLEESKAKIRSGVQLLVDTVSTVGITEVERERLSEWDVPRDPKRRYALTPQVGEDSRLIINKGLVGFRHQVDESVGIGATFGETYDLADPEQKALKVQLNLKF